MGPRCLEENGGGAWPWEPWRGLYAPWVPLATGGFVRFYDRHLHPMLKPIRSPFKQEATLEAWDFFRAHFEDVPLGLLGSTKGWDQWGSKPHYVGENYTPIYK